MHKILALKGSLQIPKRSFWDVHNPDNAITIRLKSGMFAGMEDRYDEVVVEVSNPAETISEIERALTENK